MLPRWPLLAQLTNLSWCQWEGWRYPPWSRQWGRRSRSLDYRWSTDWGEGLPGVDAEGDHGPVGVLVVVAGDGLVLFLPGGVPDVELQPQVVHTDHFPGVTDSDCHHVVFCKPPLCKTHQETALSHSWVPNYYDLPRKVEFLGLFSPAWPLLRLH